MRQASFVAGDFMTVTSPKETRLWDDDDTEEDNW